MSISKNTENPESYYYTIIGNHDVLDDSGKPLKRVLSNDVHAKAIKNRPSKNFQVLSPLDTVSFKYYIKTYPNKKPYNPLLSENSRSSFIDRVCKTETMFTEVNKSVFDKYVNFLQSKNTQWLTEVYRDIR
jgi:hypothetical protein